MNDRNSQQSPVNRLATENVAQTALEAGQRLAAAEQDPKDSPLERGVPFLILRDADGRERVEYLEKVFTAPDRKTGTVKLSDEPSLIEYWKRHVVDGHSSLYGSAKPAQFIAVFNDHGAGEKPAAFRDHRAVYTLAYSKEWTEWAARNGAEKKFSGGIDFAEWLEDHVPDIIEPAGAAMLELALNFKVTSSAAYQAATRLQDGNTEFTYTNTVDARAGSGKIQIPASFAIEIPVFEGIGAQRYRLEARFRYRLHGSSLAIWYELVRPHKVVEQAFKDILERIEAAAKIKVLFGSPE